MTIKSPIFTNHQSLDFTNQIYKQYNEGVNVSWLILLM